MPTSFVDNITQIMQELMKLPKPTKILEIGAGYGKWAVLCREYLDKYEGGQWSIQIDAVEGFPLYLERMGTELVPDKLYDVNYLTWEHDHYDLILMIDVLEHFKKDDGWQALDKARSLSNNVFISTPVDPGDQAAEYGNYLERHLSRWSHQELTSVYGDNWRPIENTISVMGFLR